MYIGIDYGQRKIGLASSEGTFATPLAVISNAPSRIQQIKEKISGDIHTVVIGIPNPMFQKQVETLADECQVAFHCQVVFQDETNSSNEALTTMIQSGIAKKKREQDDAHAAAIILQAYLDKINEKPNNK
jgi:putative transcription antitermination factor YqgF